MQSLAHSNQDAFQVATDAQCGEPLEGDCTIAVCLQRRDT
jgi:hypothetical protein